MHCATDGICEFTQVEHSAKMPTVWAELRLLGGGLPFLRTVTKIGGRKYEKSSHHYG